MYLGLIALLSAWIGKFSDCKPDLSGTVLYFMAAAFFLFPYLTLDRIISGVAFWMQTGERQTARLRLKYLQSVLRKDMNFFDTEARDSNIIFHISSDAVLVQDAIGDKVPANKGPNIVSMLTKLVQYI